MINIITLRLYFSSKRRVGVREVLDFNSNYENK